MKKQQTLHVETIEKLSEEILAEVLRLEKYLPDYFQEDEALITSQLLDPQNILVFLKDKEKVVGYSTVIPHNYARQFLLDDAGMVEDDERYYLDKYVIMPEYRKGRAYAQLMLGAFDAASRRGHHLFSSHVSCEHSMNVMGRRLLKKYIVTQRFTRLPSYCDDLFEYIEIRYCDDDERKADAVPSP